MNDTLNAPVSNDFAEEIKMLGAVKHKVLLVAQAHPSPTVQQQARLAVDQLDLAYLCLGGLRGAVEYVQSAVSEESEAALARGNLKVMPDGQAKA